MPEAAPPDPPPRRTDDTPPAAGTAPVGAGRAIARHEFEQVIRRAAELAARDGDPYEMLTEDEVLRIAQELGLQPHHVQRAMYELPELVAKPQWYDRWFDPAIFSVSRVVPSRADLTLRRMQDYLVTREYLQVVRRRGDTISFIPADDTLSSLARAFTRPNSRHIVARATRLMLSVQQLPDERAHVRFDVDLGQERRSNVNGALAAGWFGGLVVGGGAAVAANLLLPGVLGPVPEVIAFGAGLAGTGIASVRTAANRFRNRIHAARVELAGLLDRAEGGESLDPPPAPWRRRLQLRLFGG